MKKKYLLVIVTLSILLVILDITPLQKSERFSIPRLRQPWDSLAVAQLRWLDSASAERDFAFALSKRELHFVGVYGYGRDVPGFRSWNDSLVLAIGVTYIEGTSDMILSEEHHRLSQLAKMYAAEYNRLVVDYLKKHNAR